MKVQCSQLQYSAVQGWTVQCSMVQCSTVQCSAVRCSALRCSKGKLANNIEPCDVPCTVGPQTPSIILKPSSQSCRQTWPLLTLQTTRFEITRKVVDHGHIRPSKILEPYSGHCADKIWAPKLKYVDLTALTRHTLYTALGQHSPCTALHWHHKISIWWLICTMVIIAHIYSKWPM